MNTDTRDILAILKSELNFLEQGGYARQQAASWHAPIIFQDSPSCPDYNDPSRELNCAACALLQFVPEADRTWRFPCRYIPITDDGQTIEDLYRSARQQELEWAFMKWLRAKIRELEMNRAISDSMCGAKHMAKDQTAAECTRECVKARFRLRPSGGKESVCA